MILIDYFRSKAALSERAARAIANEYDIRFENYKLHGHNNQLRGSVANLEARLGDAERHVIALNEQLETERKLHKLREDVMIAAVVGIGPMLLNEARKVSP